ncbi:MAG: peptidoglycan DD-metalloendopeptidase family protein [Flavobacteriaceae bacterium]|nr:peptidoglycan DD-metalloendopeptidase family protein [Flavobacteriaceae bacterium]
MKRITKLSVSIFCLLMFSQLILSQTTRKQLESQKAAIQKELKQINELLFKNKKQKAETFSDIEKLSLKIERKQEFIKLTNKQINLLNKDLQENQKKQDQLSTELSQVRSAYKELILQSYKARSGKNRLMFVLSSETFFQAFKRTQYIKQYAVYRKAQANKILKLSEQLNKIKEELNERKLIKQQLLNDNRLTQKSLENEKKQADKIAFRLREEEKKYKKNILAKQRERTRIDKQIDKLIRDAIAASNKNKEKSDSFTLTPEAIALEKNFELNKGKLPWPVSRGVVIQKFGTQPHPVVKTAKIKSNGIVIATETSAKVKTVFKGKVLSVLSFKGSNPTILIQHGNYITAYKNLYKVYVDKGDDLQSGEVIGEVFTNSSTGESSIQFSIFKRTTALNPLSWILKM